MSGTTTFSSGYYISPTLFWKNATSERLSDGGLRIESASSWSFWDHRTTHACIDSQGTISTTPFSLFQDLKRYIGLSQNQDLIAVNQKLKALETQIQQNPNSPQVQALISEIHHQKARGSEAFTWNLVNLNTCFNAGNQAADRVATLLKVVNFFRGLFNLQPIVHYHYQPLNMQFFRQNVISPAMRLTAQERLSTRFFPQIQLNGPASLFDHFHVTLEDMQKLELGFQTHINFSIDSKRFVITYDNRNAHFVLSYTNHDSVPLVSSAQDFNYRSEPLLVRETKPDGSISDHPLQFSNERKETGHWWLGTNKMTLRHISGDLPMQAGCEYAIAFPGRVLKIRI